MTNYNTGQNDPATQLADAYIAGVQRGIAIGAVMAMTPNAKQAAGYRRRQVAARVAEYADNARRRRRREGHEWARYWPDVMPGGWPLPPDVPSDDPGDWWPEVDGWPCPPPALRGPRS